MMAPRPVAWVEHSETRRSRPRIADPIRATLKIFGKGAQLAILAALMHPAHADDLRPYQVVGDAIPKSLTGMPGDAARGRAIVLNRQVGMCLLCHSGPYPQEKFQGTLAPDLAGTGRRSSDGQLRLRMVDASRLYPDTIMPPYYRVDRLARVAASFAGKPILTAEQIEDVVAYLVTMREESKP
jgi:sulfur-oxidizing protein SoxX